jgi:hypothetical protein
MSTAWAEMAGMATMVMLREEHRGTEMGEVAALRPWFPATRIGSNATISALIPTRMYNFAAPGQIALEATLGRPAARVSPARTEFAFLVAR